LEFADFVQLAVEGPNIGGHLRKQ